MSGAPKSFSVTDATPVTGAIIPTVVTGSGPDQLVLTMSEDAYKAMHNSPSWWTECNSAARS